jgi:hypothetical protein
MLSLLYSNKNYTAFCTCEPITYHLLLARSANHDCTFLHGSAP